MYSISCCKERLNFENTLYNIISGGILSEIFLDFTRVCCMAIYRVALLEIKLQFDTIQKL
jgi:hypothetical protein